MPNGAVNTKDARTAFLSILTDTPITTTTTTATATTTTTTTTTIYDGNNLMLTEYIVTGSEHVAVQSDGTWLISGPIVLKPALSYDYMQTPHLVQERSGEDAPLVCDEHGGFTKPLNFRKRFERIIKAAKLPDYLSLHSLRHLLAGGGPLLSASRTFPPRAGESAYATRLGNGVKQPDGTILRLSPKQIANLLGHTTSEITELYYVKRDLSRLNGITDGFDV